MYKFIDLFAGVGGFHLCMHKHANVVFASEWNEHARKTYLENFGSELAKNNATFAGDISKIDPKTIPDFDILCGGFPCQPFSLAGKQLGFSHPTQGTLFFNIVNIINIKKPRVVFLENVKNLVSHDKGKTFKLIIESIKNEGYYIHHQVLSAYKHGNIPQNRERIFIVAFKEKQDYDNFKFPEPIELTTKIEDCLEQNIESKYYMNNEQSPATIRLREHIKEKGWVWQHRRSTVRKNSKGLCPTLTANMGTGGNCVPFIMDDVGIRKLTPRECFNFQGFPKSFKLPKIANCNLYKQIGNSITIPVVERISENIIAAMKKTDNK